jgi:hypothetical protein
VSNRKTSIRGLRGVVVGFAMGALLAVPAGVFLLDEDDDPGPGPALSQAPPSARQAPLARLEAPPPKSRAEASRARVRRLIALETRELLTLASKQPSERRAVMNVLWGRGDRGQARALAETDPSLASKLAALEARDRR